MVMPGPAPKEAADRRRRNAPVFDTQQLEWDGQTRGPELPFGYDWHRRTIEWWQKWQNSPQAMVMLDSDWEGLLETALLHSRLWHGGLKPSELAALSQQISRRVASYGATYEDRLKLRLHIKTDQYVLLEDIQIDKQAESAIDYVERLLKKASSKKE